MMSGSATYVPDHELPPFGQWLALGAPAAAWSAHELVSWYVASWACGAGHAGAARAVLIFTSAMALAVAVIGVAVGTVRLKKISAAGSSFSYEGRTRDEMLALSSVFLGAAFTLGLVWAALPALVLSRVCEVGP